jgi:hypothetical protein
LENDLHERKPIRSVEDLPEAKKALEDLRRVLDRFPKKKGETARFSSETKTAL